MEMLNAHDLTGSCRAAGELAGCSHNTVKAVVAARAAGMAPTARRAQLIDEFLRHLEGWVAESRGKIRGDKAHEKLLALGFTGTGRTTRRAEAISDREPERAAALLASTSVPSEPELLNRFPPRRRASRSPALRTSTRWRATITSSGG
jgi:hypothetical protein